MSPAARSTPARLWAWLVAGDPDSSWMARLVGVAVVVGMLGSAQVPPGEGWVWACLGVSVAGTLVFLVARRWRSVWPRIALGVAVPVAAATVAGGHDASGIVIALTSLAMFAVQTATPAAVTVALAAVTSVVVVMGCVAAGDSPDRPLTLVAVIAFVPLTALLRRQYHLRSAETAALLQETRRAQAEQARAAALDERARIARELHDVLAHSLGALGVQLEVAEALLAERGDVDGALARVRGSRRLAAEGLDEARAAVTALRRDALPLPDALAELADGHRRDHTGDGAHAVAVEIVGEPRPVDAAVGVSLAGTAREALTNAARHAPGAPLRMVLEFGSDAVTVAVRNGSPARTPIARTGPAGNGLVGMRERLALVGGRLTAGPEGGGWAVVAEVPDR